MTDKINQFSGFTQGSITTPQGNIPDPEPWNLEQVYKYVLFPNLKEQVEAIRAETDKDKRSEIKKNTPFVTFAGIFSPTRKNENCISRSGLIVIDDDDHETDTDQRKEKLKTGYLPGLIFVSPSGGLKIVYRIDPEQGTHLEYFTALKNYLKITFNIEADPSGKDLCRACFLSYDPAAYYTENPDILNGDFINKWKQKQTQGEAMAAPTLPDPGTQFKPGARNDYIAKIAGALHREGIPQGEAMEALARFAEPGFPLSEIQTTVKSIYNNPAFAGKQPFDPAAARTAYQINPAAEIPEPPVLIWLNKIAIATLGNFSLLIGKAKSRKTFATSCMVAAAASGYSSIEFIKGVVRAANRVLYFDTEQSEYHAQKTIKRICRQIDNDNPANIQFYGLRPLEPGQRLQVIENAIINTPGLALVVIDGIADLLSNGINDEAEAIKLTSCLLRWTREYNIHIITILHQNKGDFNARGHIGTYLQNKAETVLSVTKDQKNKDISIVAAEYCRDVDFEPFAFTIDENGLPCIADQSEGTQSRKTATMNDNFKQILPGLRAMGYAELCQEYLEISGTSMPTAKRHISEGAKRGILKKDNTGTYRMNLNISDENDPF